MEIAGTKKSLEELKSKNKIIKDLYSFLTILLTYAWLLPILLIFGIILQQPINASDWEALEGAVLPYAIFSLFLGAVVALTIIFSQRFYYKKQIIKQNLKCSFCEQEPIGELYKIPNFFIVFGLPICEQHVKSLDEYPGELLYKEQRLYKKTNTRILRLNIFIVVSGYISLWYFGFVFGLSGNLPLIVLIFVLFAIQTGLYFYLSIRAFIKIRNGIEKLQV